MLRSTVQTILLRELAAVRRSIEAYPDEESLWRQPAGLPNTGGTLALHIAGNLRHYVGNVLGGVDYTRDREAEFASRDVPRDTLLAEIDAAADAVERALGSLPDDAVKVQYPEPIGDRTFATGDMLVHLAAHLAYHLGQLDYHRRAVTGVGTGVGALSIAALPVADTDG